MTRGPSPDAPAPIATAGVVVFDGDRVLMVMPGPESQHPAGLLGLPAGRLDPGETARDAAARECAEETGITVEPGELIELPLRYHAEIERRDGARVRMTWTVFAARSHTGSATANPEAAPVWLPRTELPGRALQPNVADAIARAAELLDAG